MNYRSQSIPQAIPTMDYAAPNSINRDFFEQPPSLPRKVAELFAYVSILVAAFVSQLGIVQIPKLGGAIQMILGTLVLGIVILTGTKLTLSIWFALLINLCATTSQMIGQGEMPLVGGGLPGLAFWFCNLLTTWFVVQNRSAERRLLIFYVSWLLLLTSIGGYYQKTHKVQRLGLEGIGGGDVNPNTIAYMAGMFSVSLLFWSLRCKAAWRPVLWLLAFAMFVILVRTVSRTGVVLFAVGFLFFLVAAFAGKGMRTSGVLFIGFALIAGSQLTYLIADQLIFYQKRLELKTAEGRLGIYQMQTLSDLAGTVFIGKGPDESQLSSTGIQAHHTFVFVHMAWGGITAYPYAAWLIILGVRIYRLSMSKDVSTDIKMQVIGCFLMFLGGEFTNNVNFYTYSSVFAIAIIEKYTVAFSRKRIAERHALAIDTRARQPAGPQFAFTSRAWSPR